MIYTTDFSDPWMGYTQAALQYLCALHTVGHHDVDLRPVQSMLWWPKMPTWARRLQRVADASPTLRHVNVAHHTPDNLTAPLMRTGEKINLGLTVTETDPVPSWLMAQLNTLDGIICPTTWQADIYRTMGLKVPVHVVPHPLGDYWWDNVPVSKPDDGPYVFYYVGTWNERKNPMGVLAAYLRGFVNDGRTALALKLTTNYGARSLIEALVTDICGDTGRLDPKHGDVWIYTDTWSDEQVRWFHAEVGHCYVSAHRGEGWGYGLHQAAALGRPVIYTQWSAPTEMLGGDVGDLPVAFDLAPVGTLGGNVPYFQSFREQLMWAAPREESLIAQMRRAAALRPTRTQGSTDAIRSRLSWSTVGATLSQLVRSME